MESNLQIILRGLDDEKANKLGHVLIEIIRAFEQVNKQLDFRRMHRIIIATDFAKELAALSGQTASGNAITHTKEQYALAVAKVLLLPYGEEYEIVAVFNANFIIALTSEPGSETFRDTLHLVHHELCHVHDYNQQLDVMPGVLLRHSYSGKDIYIRPLAEACWAEYLANRLASGTATEPMVNLLVQSLADAIRRTKPEIDQAIRNYRIDGNLEALLGLFQRHGWFLAKVGAYMLGYLDGWERSLKDISPETDVLVSKSYFWKTWQDMQRALQEMFGKYPKDWKSMSIFDLLAGILENYYAEMGLILRATDDGEIYVQIPFRPETIPGLTEIFRRPIQ